MGERIYSHITMKFSILCPSRSRPNQLLRLINSLTTHTKNLNEIELLIKLDLDDKLTPLPNPSWVKTFWGQRSDYLQKDYYNWLATQSKGDYLWALADDILINTHYWDLYLGEKIDLYLKDKPDRIAYIHVEEGTRNITHPCFPLITKESFKILDMYFHPQLKSWGADRTLHEIYSHPSINRVLHVPEISISHLSYHEGKGVFDSTSKHIKDRFFEDPDCHNKVSRDIVPKQIEDLAKYIEGVNNGKRME